VDPDKTPLVRQAQGVLPPGVVDIVIDDVIVVLENIFRFVEEKKMEPFAAARAATADIGLAVLATTLSLVVIFVPVSFMSSISGRFLYQFGLTAAVAVMVSLLVSFTLTPMMSARLLRGDALRAEAGGEAAFRGGFYAWIDRGYTWSLGLAMGHRTAAAIVTVLVIAATVPLYGLVRQEYIPTDVDEAEFDVQVSGPQNVSVTAMDEVMQRVAKEIAGTYGVRLVLASAGGGFLGQVNEGSAYVRLVPHGERTITFKRVWRGLVSGDPLGGFRGTWSQRDVMQEVRRRLARIPDLRTSVRNAPSFNTGGGSFDIDFVIRGPDLSQLAKYGETLRERARALGGIADPDTTLTLDKPELRVEIDRARAADLGVDTEQVAEALRLMVGGDQEVSRFLDPTVNDDYDVLLRLAEGDRRDPRAIARL
jgi:HAE1 family hydrophobic/amphiphilic exporter-1